MTHHLAPRLALICGLYTRSSYVQPGQRYATLLCGHFDLPTLPRCALITRGDRTYVSSKFVGLSFQEVSARFTYKILPDGGWAYIDRTGLVRVQ